MTSNVHAGSCNLFVKLNEMKLWCSRKFATQNISLVTICKISSIQNLKILQIFCLKTFYSITVQISKLVNLNSIFLGNFPCASRMSKLLQVYLVTYVHFVIVEHCRPFLRNLSVECQCISWQII